MSSSGAFIDWVTVTVPYSGPRVFAGIRQSINADGEVEWQVDMPRRCEGSHDAAVQVRSRGDNMLWMSGNFLKFLQGHSLFGTDDVSGLCAGAAERLQELGLVEFSDSDVAAIAAGYGVLSRVDCTRMVRFEKQSDVGSFIRHCSTATRSRSRENTAFEGSCLYWGKRSRRWSLKLYDKCEEMHSRGHGLPESFTLGQRLLLEGYMERTARLELVLRQMELKRKSLGLAWSWRCGMADELLDGVVDGLDVQEEVPAPDRFLEALNGRRVLQAAYLAWNQGVDVRAMGSRASRYRWRNELLALGGPDIFLEGPRSVDQPVKQIHVREVLRSEVCGIPAWADELGLLFVPDRLRVAS